MRRQEANLGVCSTHRKSLHGNGRKYGLMYFLASSSSISSFCFFFTLLLLSQCYPHPHPTTPTISTKTWPLFSPSPGCHHRGRCTSNLHPSHGCQLALSSLNPLPYSDYRHRALRNVLRLLVMAWLLHSGTWHIRRTDLGQGCRLGFLTSVCRV